MDESHATSRGDTRRCPISVCNGIMTFKHVVEMSACFVGEGALRAEPIPAHDAWVCDECGHEIRAD